MASTISAGTTAGTAIVVSGDTSGSLALQTNGTTTAVTIDTSQNVGIGTTSPSRKLDVSASSAAGSSIEIGNTNTQSSTVAAINTTGTTYSYAGVGGSTIWYYGNKTVALGTDGAYPIQFVTNGSEQMRIDTAGLLKFNSGYGSAATAYGCRAWVNFNGEGTVAIRASGKVSSITDGGTGNYTINFTTAIVDANYSTVSLCGTAGVSQGLSVMQTITTTTAPVFTVNTGGTQTDYSSVTVSIFR